MKWASALITIGMLSITAGFTMSSPPVPQYSIEWRTMDGGGGEASGGQFDLAGTIGQPDPGVSSGGIYALAGGFWAGADFATVCAGDTDADGVLGVTDFLALLAAWGTTGPSLSDIDADGIVGVDDFLALLAAWGSCP